MQLLLFDHVDDAQPSRTITLDPVTNRSRHYWHVFVPGIEVGQIYGYRVERAALERELRFDPRKVLLDPYGPAIARPANYSRVAATKPGDMGLQFLVAGAREFGEPGVLVTFEESVEEVTADVASLGFDLDGLQRDGLLVIYAFRAEPIEVVGTGEFNFEPLFLLLDDAIKRIGARRVVLDTIEALFSMFSSRRSCGLSWCGCSAG